jgi:catechol 2,3-dioxygenase-like lactoylglutathione lyase family enzyme
VIDMLATWKDLCLDAHDPAALARFWAGATGLSVGSSGDDVWLDGPTPGHRIWVNQVDRSASLHNRIHLDVYAASLDDLVEQGARVLSPAEETGFTWSVLSDPEGGEFCAFLRAPDVLPSYRLHGIVIGCVDPEPVARWWGRVFGVDVVENEDWWTLEGVTPDEVLTLDFVPVDEAPRRPQRVHWDVTGQVDELLAAGATSRWETAGWTVLADPEGNDFCVFEPLTH